MIRSDLILTLFRNMNLDEFGRFQIESEPWWTMKKYTVKRSSFMTSGVQQTLLAMIPYWPYAGHQRCSGPIFSAWYDWGPTRPLESGGRCTSHGQSKIGEYSSNCYSWCKICMMLSDGKSPLPCTCTCTISIHWMERRLTPLQRTRRRKQRLGK